MKAFENKETGLITSLDFKMRRVRIGYWIMFAILLIIALIFLFPAVCRVLPYYAVWSREYVTRNA